MEPATVVEIITLRLRDGVNDTQFLAANQRVESEHVVRQPGFISRQTARGDSGEWLVIVHWASLSAADASMASFTSAPATQGFMAVIDGSSMTMKRYTLQK
jgi:heme-degrading monooxygenase HmoA